MDKDQLCWVLGLFEAGPGLWSGMETLLGIVLTPNIDQNNSSGQTIVKKDERVSGALAFLGRIQASGKSSPVNYQFLYFATVWGRGLQSSVHGRHRWLVHTRYNKQLIPSCHLSHCRPSRAFRKLLPHSWQGCFPLPLNSLGFTFGLFFSPCSQPSQVVSSTAWFSCSLCSPSFLCHVWGVTGSWGCLWAPHSPQFLSACTSPNCYSRQSFCGFPHGW